jgi:putative tryptophan/tyrosine transport system substrate-binding protein
MRRRDFITGIGVAAVVWPLAAHAQQAVPVIGFLFAQSARTYPELIEAFRQGLSQAGFVEGQNLAIEYRWAENHYDRLPALAADLVARKVAVIVAAGGGQSPLAAKPTTATIPIVFTMGDLDPVAAGLVASINRPGGNVTGVVPMVSALGPKRLELLHEIAPGTKRIAMLSNPNHTDAADQVKDMRVAAHALGLELLVYDASSETEIDTAFAALVRDRSDALIIAADLYLAGQYARVIALALRHRLPVMYTLPTAVHSGGLMSYSPDILDSYRQAGIYTARILKGEKPADLPVVLSSKFEFLINLRTAKALGLTVPQTILLRADEVIE